MSKKNQIISLILNSINAIIIFVCAITRFFEDSSELLDDPGVESFKYFTLLFPYYFCHSCFYA